jgi:RimJ/RimL family protein N-acetyltransferase
MIGFRPLALSDLPLLHDWLGRPHVARWWGDAGTLADVHEHYAPMTRPAAGTRGYVALHSPAAGRPATLIGFLQCYGVMGSGEGWWEDETDPGARGIDQFLADESRLGRGLGTAMVRAFVDRLFEDPAVTQVQTDPSPDNLRAIRCYEKAGFKPQRVLTTPDGPALLMLRRRGDASAA